MTEGGFFHSLTMGQNVGSMQERVNASSRARF